MVTEGLAEVAIHPPVVGVTFVRFDVERFTVSVRVVLLLQNGRLKINISTNRAITSERSATFHLLLINILKLDSSLGAIGAGAPEGKTWLSSE